MSPYAVTFTPTARRDFAAILETIADGSGARVAARWRRLILERADLLADQPHLGAHDDQLGPGRRRLVVAPYLIVYAIVSSDAVAILRIIHGARDLPTLFGESTGE